MTDIEAMIQAHADAVKAHKEARLAHEHATNCWRESATRWRILSYINLLYGIVIGFALSLIVPAVI